MKKNKIEVIAGNGRLSDRNPVVVGATQVKAPHVMVATGCVVKPLPGIEFDGEYIVSSDHATLARSVPESICIIGAGAVGVEFPTLYNQLGVKVTLLEGLARLVPLQNQEISHKLLPALTIPGIDSPLALRAQLATT